jgi:hypothetical protein
MRQSAASLRRTIRVNSRRETTIIGASNSAMNQETAWTAL